ncbi:hypothetical protein [Nonomuraea sp. NPDC048916]|uniref:hypothetical protein n=1 Tax=Nonomuraea sp. NPDC048916 TaxID=3154232 RepID=UPI0033FB5AA5
MPSKEQVLRLVSQGHDYDEIATTLGIPPGQAYLIATGIPADNSGTLTHDERARPGILLSHPQRLVNPREVNPVTHGGVSAWIRSRIKPDKQLRAAGGN